MLSIQFELYWNNMILFQIPSHSCGNVFLPPRSAYRPHDALPHLRPRPCPAKLWSCSVFAMQPFFLRKCPCPRCLQGHSLPNGRQLSHYTGNKEGLSPLSTAQVSAGRNGACGREKSKRSKGICWAWALTGLSFSSARDDFVYTIKMFKSQLNSIYILFDKRKLRLSLNVKQTL